MNSITSDWCQFCESKMDFDKSHFYTLFWEGIEDIDLQEIFKYFPLSQKLYLLMKDYLFGRAIKKINRIKDYYIELTDSNTRYRYWKDSRDRGTVFISVR